MQDDGADFCPHCVVPFEIVFVKFRIRRVAMVVACPNCAVTFADEGTVAELWRPLKATARAMNWLDTRFRYVVGSMFAAVLVAALLRHGFHIYGGLPPEKIREYALLALPAAVLLFGLLRAWRRR